MGKNLDTRDAWLVSCTYHISAVHKCTSFCFKTFVYVSTNYTIIKTTTQLHHNVVMVTIMYYYNKRSRWLVEDLTNLPQYPMTEMFNVVTKINLSTS